MEQFFELLSLVNSSGIQSTIGPVRWVLGGVGFLMLSFVVFIIARTAWLKYAVLFDATEFLTYRPYGLRRMAGKWNKVITRLETGNEGEYKLAVIEADGMLNEVLTRLGFHGETISDKLAGLTPAIVPNLPEVEEAHQIRNNVVQDPDYILSLSEARRVLGIYETAFRNLDLI